MNACIYAYLLDFLVFATPETTDGLGTSTQTIPEGNALTSVFNNLSLAIFLALLFLHNTAHVTFSHPVNYAIKKSLSESQHGLHLLLTVHCSFF